MAFVPPYPPRPVGPLPALERLRLASRSFLAMWEERSFDLELMHERVLARDVFICNAPDIVRQMLVTHNDGFERKSAQIRHALKPLVGDGLFISDGPIWRQRRKMIAPIIHASHIGSFAPIMVETAAETLERWRALSPGAEISVQQEMATLTAEIICRTIFGRTLGHAYAREIVESFSDYQESIGQIGLFSLIGLPDWLPRIHPFAVRRSVRRITRVLDAIIASYRERASQADDDALIGQLINARDDQGRPLEPAAIRNEAAVIFLAGQETSANTLSWAWYLLAHAPDVEARLHAELDGVLGGRAPALGDLANLPYARAIIEETLRLYPPVPLLTREALRDETLRGRPVRKGSLVMVVPWLLHRHKRLWDDPDAFIPERFLPGAARPIDRYAYVPFSAGPRVCAGQMFGMTESILALATLAQRFALRLRRGAKVEAVCRLTLRPEGGLPMTVHPRDVTAVAEPGVASVASGCPFA